jgi:hypothetical protein
MSEELKKMRRVNRINKGREKRRAQKEWERTEE